MSQLNENFYQAGSHHVCRFCSTPLARLKEGKLRPLASKAHVLMLLVTGTIHRFNACKNCVKNKDFAEKGLLRKIWELDIKVWKNLEVLQGEDIKEATERANKLLKIDIVPDFFYREVELKDGPRGEKKAKKRLQTLNNKKDK